MEMIRNFNDLGKGDAAIAGGKGASLGEMTQAGMNVPFGFVILATVFENILRESGIGREIENTLDAVDYSDAQSIESASDAIRNMIFDVVVPENIVQEIHAHFKDLDAEYVAIRSSATAEDGRHYALAGQLESFLNTNENALLMNIKKCWASLFSPRALAYLFESKLPIKEVSVAVVVQTMIQSEVSGTAFSIHPVTGNSNQMVIEAVYGLGEAIVSGQITPDSYTIDKNPRSIAETKKVTQEKGIFQKSGGGNEWTVIEPDKQNVQKLSSDEILKLFDVILVIESHYGFPCDIEWAFTDGEFSIVQSRPITTIGAVKKNERYKKMYTRENSLIALQIWERHQCDLLREKLGSVVPFSIFDVYDGVANVYYREDISEVWSTLITDAVKQDPNFVVKTMKWFGELLDQLEVVWYQEKMDSVQELLTVADLASLAWVGVSISYFLPSLSDISQESQNLGMALRERSVDFLERTDRVIQNTLKHIYPNLGDLVKYLTIEEVRSEALPSQEVLMNRQKHYIYFGFEVYVERDIREFIREHSLIIIQENVPDSVEELHGQTAMGGLAQGIVRVVHKKSDINLLQEGEILVTAMTTPDYVPAMRKAVAFVTDEGGITCHAAIVAREFGKPCIIGTKIATKVLHTGDLVEVDADNGVVRVVKK
jgi:phosphoenolpyruvate synthase/pyruvate phosphate dikinase